MLQHPNHLHSIAIALSLGLGSTGLAKESDRPIEPIAPATLPAREIASEPLQLSPFILHRGQRRFEFERVDLSKLSFNELPAFKQLSSLEFARSSIPEQAAAIHQAHEVLYQIYQMIPSESAKKQVVRAVVDDLSDLDLFYNNLQQLNSPSQQMALEMMQTLGDVIAQDDQLLNLSQARGSLNILWGWRGLLARGIEQERALLLVNDASGTSTFEHLHRLITHDNSPETMLFALDLMADLRRPRLAGFQISNPGCLSGGLCYYILMNQPGEYVRLAVELYVSGQTKFSSGTLCEIDRGALTEEQLKNRSASGVVLQRSLIKLVSSDPMIKGINLDQYQELASSYLGSNCEWFEGAEVVANIVAQNPGVPIFGAFFDVEQTDGWAVSILCKEVRDGRLYYRDSNGNYNLHMVNSDPENPFPAPDWRWMGGVPEGANQLPSSLAPMFLVTRGFDYEIGFVGEGQSPAVSAPGFVRHHPERRMEDWNSGEFSIEISELKNANAKFLIPLNLIADASLLKGLRTAQTREAPQVSPYKDPLVWGISLGAGFAYVLLSSYRKRNQKPAAQ